MYVVTIPRALYPLCRSRFLSGIIFLLLEFKISFSLNFILLESCKNFKFLQSRYAGNEFFPLSYVKKSLSFTFIFERCFRWLEIFHFFFLLILWECFNLLCGIFYNEKSAAILSFVFQYAMCLFSLWLLINFSFNHQF